jgi:hypothetical protein
MRGGSIVHEERVEYEPSSLAYSSVATHLAVGDAKANMLRIYLVQVDKFFT